MNPAVKNTVTAASKIGGDVTAFVVGDDEAVRFNSFTLGTTTPPFHLNDILLGCKAGIQPARRHQSPCCSW